MVNRKTRRNKIVRRRNKSCCNKFKGGALQGGTTPPPPGSTANSTSAGLNAMGRIQDLEEEIAALRVERNDHIMEINRLNRVNESLRLTMSEGDTEFARQINNEPEHVRHANAVPVAMARQPGRSMFFGSRFRRGRVIPTATEIVGEAPAIARAEGIGTRNMKKKNKKKSEKKKGRGRK
mgnify:CR=1 FL=1|tara:strand:- start:1152 stop:1688 length:537 start_codon:yes stop_codon:yes gene_type:complete